MSSNDNREEALFEHCLGLPPEERERYLREQCPDEPELVESVLALLRSHDSAGEFLDELPAKDSFEVASRLGRIAPTEERPGDQIGRYRLLELIGEGAWGTVWIAQQASVFDRQVAIKILKVGMDTKDFLARFEAERQMLAMMDHPNIAKVLDVGSSERGRPFLVMELVKGVQILEFADKNRLGIRERVELFTKVCRALHHAHRKGVVHRDLKPSNILVSAQYDEALPKVIDFGVAKSNQFRGSGGELYTSMHTFIGTPVYSSPEQLEFTGRDVDARSDIYSLGALLYELLCGAAPFDGEAANQKGMAEFVRQVREDDPPRSSWRFASLPAEEKNRIATKRGTSSSKLESLLKGELDWVALKCLEKDPSKRYDTARDLADDLQAFLDDQMVSASPPSPWRKLRKTIFGKRPTFAAWVEMAAVIVIALVAVFYLGTRQSGSEGFGQLEIRPDSSIQFTDISVAVLPLDHRSSQEEDFFFTDGFHDELITHISKIKDIRTIARTSVMGYRGTTERMSEIGEQLNVRYLVEGGVQRGGEAIRINVSLIDTSTESHVWAENYTRKMSAKNVFDIQNEIAHQIASNLQVLLSSSEEDQLNKLPTENLAALEAYFKGKELMDDAASADMVEAAIDYFEKAISLDPEFALSHAHLAGCQIYLMSVTQRPREPLFEKGQFHVDRALEIDREHAEALFYAGWLEERRGNIQVAVEILERVVRDNPSYVRAHIRLAKNSYRLTGDNAERVRRYEKALSLDPEGPRNESHRFNLLAYKGQWEEMLRHQLQRVSESPQNAYFQELLAVTYLQKFGRYDEAIIAHRKRLELDPRNSHSAAEIVRCYQFLGDTEQAIAWGEKYLSLWPESNIVESLRRDMHWYQGNDAQVKQIALKYLENRPKTYWPLLLATDIDLKQGNLEEAMARLRNAFSGLFDPDVEVRYGGIGTAVIAATVLAESGENEQAERIVSQVLGLQNINSRLIHFEIRHQVFAYHAKGDQTGTLETIQKYFDEGGSPYYLELTHFLKPYLDLPEYQAMAEKRRAELAIQLERIRNMEANNELAPLPEHLAN